MARTRALSEPQAAALPKAEMQSQSLAEATKIAIRAE
jgi:hypothetical protein